MERKLGFYGEPNVEDVHSVRRKPTDEQITLFQIDYCFPTWDDFVLTRIRWSLISPLVVPHVTKASSPIVLIFLALQMT